METTSLNILKNHINRKLSRNKNYSKSALARDLGISPTYLSEILNGKKRIPVKRINDFISCLDMDEYSANEFLKSIADEQIGPVANSGTHSVESFVSLEAKNSKIFDSWYFIPIMELINCKSCVHDSSWISREIGVSVEEVNHSLDWLMEEGYIIFENDKYKKVNNKIRFPSNISKKSIRSFHRQMIKKSLNELSFHTDQKDFDERLINGITISANKKQIAKAKIKLNEALHEVALILMDGTPDTVIQLNAQLFSLLKKK